MYFIHHRKFTDEPSNSAQPSLAVYIVHVYMKGFTLGEGLQKAVHMYSLRTLADPLA